MNAEDKIRKVDSVMTGSC